MSVGGQTVSYSNQVYNRLTEDVSFQDADNSEQQSERSKPGCFTRAMKWVCEHPCKSFFIAVGVVGVTSGTVSLGVVLGLGGAGAALSARNTTLAPNVTNFMTTNGSAETSQSTTTTSDFAPSTSPAPVSLKTTQEQTTTDSGSVDKYRGAYCEGQYVETWHYCCEDPEDTSGQNKHYFRDANSTYTNPWGASCPGHEEYWFPGETECTKNDRAEEAASMTEYCKDQHNSTAKFDD